MKHAISLVFIAANLLAVTSSISAQYSDSQQPASKSSDTVVVLPVGITEEMLAPPPVPSFMLKPPNKALSMDEMVQQAREAEQKAGIKPPLKPAK